MSNDSRIGDSSQVKSSYGVEEESHPQEMSAEAHQAGNAEKATEEKPTEDQDKQVENLTSSFPVPLEIADQIAGHLEEKDLKSMRLVNSFFLAAATRNVRRVRLTQPKDEEGRPTIPQAASAFNGARHLTIAGNQFTDDQVNLEAFKTLRSVTFMNSNGLRGGALAKLPGDLHTQRIHIAPEMVDEDLKGLPRDLKVFASSNTGISDAGMKNIPRGVKAMGLLNTHDTESGKALLTDAGVKDYPPGLKRLLLISMFITDRGIKDMPRGLEELEVLSGNVTGAAIEYVPKGVHTLTLRTGKDMLNAGTENLSKNVHTFTVSAESVSDEAISTLPKTLRTLHLVGNVSPERLEKLRAENRDLTITTEPADVFQSRYMEKQKHFS